MIVDLSRSAILILSDLIFYGQKYPDRVATAIYCKEEAFRIRLARLAEDIKRAEESEINGN